MPYKKEERLYTKGAKKEEEKMNNDKRDKGGERSIIWIKPILAATNFLPG